MPTLDEIFRPFFSLAFRVQNAHPAADWDQCYAMALRVRLARVEGCTVRRVGAHTTSPGYVNVWLLDPTSPSRTQKMSISVSVKITAANLACLEALGVS